MNKLKTLKTWMDTRSLKFKLWTYFVLFAGMIIVILWLLQIVLLNTYYKTMKTREIKKIGNQLVSEYGQDYFEDLIYRTSFKDGMIIQVLNEQGIPILPVNSFEDVRPPRINPTIVLQFIQKLSESEDGRVLYTVEDFRLRAPTVVYGAVLPTEGDEPLYLYINGILEPIDSTISVLKDQLIIVTIISLLLAIALSFLIASKVSRPITKLTNAASILAEGNYDVVFENGDYTEINKLADTLNYTTQELSKTEAVRRDFIASVSHDLKTPLTLIKSYAEMIRDISGNQAEKRNAHLKVIVDETNRLTELVNDILSLSQLQSGMIEMKYHFFDIGKTTKNILKLFQVLSEKDGYVFTLDCDENTVVMGDERKMEQVIYNLISNAVNFTGEDHKIMIRIKEEEEDIRWEVQDTGPGIKEEDLRHIWERYYRSSEKTHQRTVVGTGVGLSIVKNILMAHEASFGIDSTVGKGSRFWFSLKKSAKK